MEAIRIQETIQKRGELTLKNLPVEEGQQVEVLLLFNPAQSTPKQGLTARDLLQSDLIGLWADRIDITDSALYARQLRQQSQTRVIMDRSEDDSLGQ